MSQINPFAGAIAQTPQAAKLAAIDRDAQVRKTAEKLRSGGSVDHNVDEFVESADTVSAVGDDDRHDDPREKKRRRRHAPDVAATDGETPHLDVTA